MKRTFSTYLAITAMAVFATGLHAAESKKAAKQKNAVPDSVANDLKLEAGAEGTIFKSLRIEGEDRVRVEFDRPRLNLNLDPYSAPGLDWEGFHSVLNRSGVGLMSPYLQRAAYDRHPYYARPWLNEFSIGEVVTFRPDLDGVDRWRLTVANSKGETVAVFEGEGKPPKTIAWDGRSPRGTGVPPGYTYSYVLEAFDEAGNKRNFVGEGFDLPSYRLTTQDGTAFLFAGDQLVHQRPDVGGDEPPPALLLEAASWINQSADIGGVVRIEVTARTFDDAKRLAATIAGDMRSLLLGDPSRIQPVTLVEPDAPDRGTIAIVVAGLPKATD